MHLVLISGLSGSGKSIALKVLEDANYYCVDNLPSQLLQPLVGQLELQGYDKVGVVIDIRGGDSVAMLPLQLDALRANPNTGGALTFAEAARARGASLDFGLKLDDQLRGFPQEMRDAALDVLLLVGASYDEVLWPTLQELARQPDRLPKFRDQLVQLLVGQRMPVPKAMVQAGQSMGLSPNLINQWANQR